MRFLLVRVSDTELVFCVGIAHFCQGEMLLCDTAGEALMGMVECSGHRSVDLGALYQPGCLLLLRTSGWTLPQKLC